MFRKKKKKVKKKKKKGGVYIVDSNGRVPHSDGRVPVRTLESMYLSHQRVVLIWGLASRKMRPYTYSSVKLFMFHQDGGKLPSRLQ